MGAIDDDKDTTPQTVMKNDRVGLVIGALIFFLVFTSAFWVWLFTGENPYADQMTYEERRARIQYVRCHSDEVSHENWLAWCGR